MGLIETIKGLFGTSINYQEIVDGSAIIVDVRTPEEFKSGNVKGSLNIPLDKLDANLKKIKDKEVVLVCKSGLRAGRAKTILTSKGIQAHNAGAWQNLLK